MPSSMKMQPSQPRRIESPANPLVKELAGLKERRARDRRGEFLIEGAREASRAVAGGVEVVRVIHCPEFNVDPDAVAPLVQAVAGAGGEVLELSPAAFAKLSLRQHPDGVALQARRPTRSLADLGDLREGLVLVVDGVEKPGNLGAVLRTADAVGVAAVIVSGQGTDLENPNVVRASQGSLFALPLATATAAEALAFLTTRGYRLIATSPAATLAHWSADYRGPVAVLLGPEDEGLSASWLTAADQVVRIEMRAGAADSLNVSVAAAVVLYEALRQRSVGAAT